MCIGDFNELMHSGEKEGGSSRPVRQMANFCEVINSCQLHDLGYIGLNFTWILPLELTEVNRYLYQYLENPKKSL